MKQLKKIASIMLALVMVLAMAIPVMATSTESTERGTITINNATKGNTYTIYRIFELVSYDSKGHYSYKVVEKWEDFVNGEEGRQFVTLDDDNYVTLNENANNDAATAAFAKAALDYANDHQIEGDSSAEANDNTKVEFSNLPLGYYLVDSTVGALCSLNTTDPNAVMNDKNEEPKIDKEVQEGDDFDSVNDANIGDTVTFKATITARKGAQKYVMHDEMSAGLTYKEVSEIKLNPGTNTEKDLVAGTDYDLKIRDTDSISDTCTFEIVFKQDFCDTLGDNDQIVVTYTATVNEDAILSTDPDTNKAILDYGEGNHTESITKTYVWEFDMSKIDGATGDDREPLAGAEFTLYRTRNGNEFKEPVEFLSVVDGQRTDADVYRVADGESGATSKIITTTKKICFRGLDSGTYYLKETKAPDGYNTPTEPVVVQINFADSDNDGEKECTILHDGDEGAIEIVNNTGTVLPSTGGIGTTIFYVVGGILVVGAAIVLVAKKRTKDE